MTSLTVCASANGLKGNNFKLQNRTGPWCNVSRAKYDSVTTDQSIAVFMIKIWHWLQLHASLACKYFAKSYETVIICLRKPQIILLYFKDFCRSNMTVVKKTPIPCVFIQGYPGGGFSHLPSSFNIWDLSEAKVARNCSAGTTRKNLWDKST